MIGCALQFVTSLLNQFLKSKFQADEGKVVMNSLVEANGTIPEKNRNKVVLSLINIEKESANRFYNTAQPTNSSLVTSINPAQRFNLDILICSNFDDYDETLKFLNAAILFFQAHPVLDARVSSSIPVGLQKLEFEIEKMSHRDMHSLWTAMGAKYQPSILYKMRLITIQSSETHGFVPVVSQTSNTAER